jgi:hypothetical protein
MPDGRTVEIDEEIAPLIEQLWRLGYVTKVACQDAGEAILNGGTRTLPERREERVAVNAGRAWIIVRKEQGPRLLDEVRSLDRADQWELHAVAKDSNPDAWISLTFPRADIAPATDLLAAVPTRGPAATSTPATTSTTTSNCCGPAARP